MRHGYFGKKLSRTKNERRMLLRNLLCELIRHGKIVTSLTKAKVIAPMIDQLITKAKTQTDANRKQILAALTDRNIVAKLLDDAKTRFMRRSSGFTRIVKLGLRRGDATQQAMITFVDEKPITGEIVADSSKKVVKPPKLLPKTKVKPTKKNPKK